MKKTGIIIAIGIVIIAIIAVVMIGMNNSNKTDNSTSSTSTNSSTGNTTTAAATITYSDSGFSPATITVKSGDTVAIKNTSSSPVHFDSDPHPVHTDNTDLNVDDVDPGQTKTFTVTKKGTFGYHNHLAPTEKGEIVIE